jgi:hypothetical protein
MDAWRATERVYLEARIIGERGEAGSSGVALSLLQGVLGVGRSVFTHVETDAEVVWKTYRSTQRSKKLPELLLLALVMRGDEKSHSP